jgi:hypothetical protein
LSAARAMERRGGRAPECTELRSKQREREIINKQNRAKRRIFLYRSLCSYLRLRGVWNVVWLGRGKGAATLHRSQREQYPWPVDHTEAGLSVAAATTPVVAACPRASLRGPEVYRHPCPGEVCTRRM